MENSVTFPFDPNVTQTGFWSGTRQNAQNRRPPEFSGRRRSHFSLFHPTLAMKPLIFCAAAFFMPGMTCVYTSSENSAEA